MQSKFTAELFRTMEQQNNQEFNVLIAYDNAVAGLRAMRIFSKIAEDHRDELAFQTLIWRFDLLTDPALRKGADADAMKADMLVISIEGKADLPAGVRGWLTACLSQKSGRPGAVVAIFGPEEDEDDVDSPRLKFAKRAAEEAGLHFFAPLPRRKTNLSLNIAHFYSWESITGSGYDLADQSKGYQHWAINE